MEENAAIKADGVLLSQISKNQPGVVSGKTFGQGNDLTLANFSPFHG
jgi:hypothetical protein